MLRMTTWYFFFGIFILISNPMLLTFADSSRVIIPVEEDIFVDESNFFNPRSQLLITGFGGTNTKWIFDGDHLQNKPRVVSNEILPITSYLKFDLSTIPSSTLFETVSIENSKLRLFFTSPDDSDATMYFFTVSYCVNNQWSEKDLIWDNRPCKNNLQPVDTMIINEKDIPGLVELDIVEAINIVKEEEKSKITLVLDAQPILFDVDYNASNIGNVTNFIRDNWKKIQLSDFNINKETFQGRVDREFNGIWKEYLTKELLTMKYIDVNFIDNNLQSLNYTVTNSHILRLASSESGQSGHATSPTIIIDYRVTPSVFNDSIIFTLTVILPTLVIIVPVLVWIYKKSKK